MPTYTLVSGNDVQLRPGVAHAMTRLGAVLPSLLARGAKLKNRPRVRVTDIDGNLVDDAIVVFTKNRGTFNTAHPTAAGEAEGPEWTLPTATPTTTRSPRRWVRCVQTSWCPRHGQ